MCVCVFVSVQMRARETETERESKRRTNEMNYTMATDKAGGNSWILVW